MTAVSVGRLDPGRRQITVNLAADLVDWLDEQADTHAHGREIVVERALRDWRRVVERDRANPRPDQ